MDLEVLKGDIENIEDDINIGMDYGYYTVMKKAGRNRSYQQRYSVHCKCCDQVFTKTLYSIKQAIGKDQCKHARNKSKAVVPPHPCEYCGNMTTNFKYCCRSCKTAAINEATKRKPSLLCLFCGKPTPSRKQTLCSPECRHLYRVQKMYGIGGFEDV